MRVGLDDLGQAKDDAILADRLLDVLTVINGAAALLGRRWEELGEAGRGELVRVMAKGVERGAALLAGRDLPWLEWQLEHYFVLVRVAAVTLASPGSGEQLRRDAVDAIRSGAPSVGGAVHTKLFDPATEPAVV